MRNFIDLQLLDGRPPKDLWFELPITPSIPLPTKGELKRHALQQHMRGRTTILREQAIALAAAQEVMILPGLSVRSQGQTDTLTVTHTPGPKPPPPPKRAPLVSPRLHKRPQEAATPRLLTLRAKRYGWPVEAQEALREYQGNRCAVCGIEDPTIFDVVKDEETQIVHGYLCHRCQGIIRWANHQPQLLQQAIDYLAHPPALEMARV